MFKRLKKENFEKVSIYLFIKFLLNLKIKQRKNLSSKFKLNKDFINLFLNVEKKLHKKKLEIYWTLIPALILFIIGAPSLSVLYSISEVIAPELTIKAVGNQWFWTYEYSINTKSREVQNKNIDFVLSLFKSYSKFKGVNLYKLNYNIYNILKLNFKSDYNRNNGLILNVDSIIRKNKQELDIKETDSSYKIKTSKKLIYESHMILEDELKSGELRLLEVDYWLILPINIEIRLLVSSVDVIHSFAVPSFGVKVDGIPGRTNEVPLFIKRKGVFYGQCSELCGVNHGFMPIVVQSMNKKSFTDILIELIGQNFGRE